MNTEAEDEVVQEFNLYLNKTLSKNLHIFQYPCKPSRENFSEKDVVVGARVKPVLQKVELELALDCNSQNYDHGRGEQFVLNMKGNDEMFKNNHSILEIQTLMSTKAISSSSNYAVGLVVKGELHLVPIELVLQLRPSFNYINAADGVKSKKDTAEDMEEEEAQAITVKFASQETEKSKAAKEKSFHFLQKKAANEPWIKTNFYPSSSGRASLQHSLLRCSQKEQDSSDIQCTASDFIGSLVPIECNGTSKSITGLLQTKSSSNSDRVKNILINAKVVKFDQIVEILKPIDPALVLRLLQPIAVLVQGCWVVKSETLYPKDTFSPVTRIPAEILCRVRDFVIWKFVDNPSFNRKDVPPNLKLANEDWKNILSDISERQSDGRWKFRYECDLDFIQSYPEAVQRQTMLWSARNQVMNKIASGGIMTNSISTPNPRSEPTSPTSQAKKPRRKSSREDSPQKTVGGKQNHDSKEDVGDGPASLPDLHKSLTLIMKNHHCLSLSQLRSYLSPTYQKCGDKELEDSLVKVNGVFKLSNKWPQNALEEPIYGLIRVGDNLDKLREALLDLFSKTARMRITTFQKKVEDELGGKSSAAEANCKKILNEFCLLKAGFYYMKGTIALDSETKKL